MPRISGGGGPIIPPQTPGSQSTQNAQQSNKSDFASKIQQGAQQGTDAARTQQAKQSQQSKLTGKATDIAKRLNSGDLTQREAVQEFVSLVIEERFPKFKKKKRGKKDDDESGQDNQIEEAVAELIDSDPALANRLQTQFKKLAAKG